METKTFLMTSSYYPPYHIGGDATHVKYLSEELVKLGHEVHIMFSIDAYRYKRPGFRATLKEVEESNGVILHPLQSPMGKAEPYLTYLTGNSQYVKTKFKNLLNEIKPDVVHHHNIFFLGYDILRKQGNYINLYTAHDYWLICQRYDLMRYGHNECDKRSCFLCALHARRAPQIWRNGKEFKNAIENIDTIIAPSSFMKRELVKLLPLKSNVVYVPNFVPVHPLNIKKSEYSNYLLYVGVLERHKGICELVKAFKDSTKLDTKLVIVGKGSLKKKITDYIVENNLERKIIILGWVSNEMLTSLYKDAVALVIPSIWAENCPLVALESISHGIPIIASNVGGLPEIIETTKSGILIDGKNENALKKGLVDSFSKITEPLWGNLRNNANSSSNYYSKNNYIKKYLNIANENSRCKENNENQ